MVIYTMLVGMQYKIRVPFVLLVEPCEPSVKHILGAPQKLGVLAPCTKGFNEPEQIERYLARKVSAEI